MLSGLNLSVLFSLATACAMVGFVSFILWAHDTNHDKFEEWVDFSFTSDSLRRALGYYRLIAVSMLFTYVLFTSSLVWLQADGFVIFAENGQPVRASPIAVSLFSLDLLLRGGFFDFMNHFDLTLSYVKMNRGVWWFVIYSFMFRLFYGLTMFKILFSFLWIYGKIRLNRQAAERLQRDSEAQLKLFK